MIEMYCLLALIFKSLLILNLTSLSISDVGYTINEWIENTVYQYKVTLVLSQLSLIFVETHNYRGTGTTFQYRSAVARK